MALFGALAGDIRHAWRSIRRMPVVATVIVLSLGAGIGVNTAIFSWIQLVVFQPVPGVERISEYRVIEPRSDTGGYPGLSWLEYRDLSRDLTSTRHLLAFRMTPFTLGEASETTRAYGMFVSANYFSSLGLTPALGRFFRADEGNVPGSAPVVVISSDLWRQRFNRDSSVLGRTIRVNDRLLNIIGVAPERFQGTVLALSFDLWVPATMAPELMPGSRELDDRTQRGYSVMGRLIASQAQAEADASNAIRRFARDHPKDSTAIGADVLEFDNQPRGPQRLLKAGLIFLQAVLLLLWLTVCGNTANLILARASVRRREVAVRLALGAGARRIVSLMLSETMLLAVMSTVVGVLAGVWGTGALRAVPLSGALPFKFQTHVDAVSVAFAVALGLGSGFLIGAAPALQLARLDPLVAMRQGARAVTRSTLRNALMGVQVTLALIVLVAAAIFFRSFSETRTLDTGFKTDGVLLAAYDLTGRKNDPATVREFTATLADRVRALPGVEAAAIASSVPLDIHGLPSRGFELEGHAREDAQGDSCLFDIVTPGYFRVMDVPFVEGSDFADLRDADAAPQAIVNDAFARHYLPDIDAVGRRINARGKTFTIVGVVKTTLYSAFGEAPTPVIFYSYRDLPALSGEIHVRTMTGREMTLGPAIERTVRALDPTLPVYNIRTLADHIDRNLVLRRVPARMFAVLGPLLLALAAIGIYAVVSYGVAQRTAEVSVRLALGATPRRVVWEIVVDSMNVIAMGALAGWVLAYGVDLHVVQGASTDTPILVGVPVILLAVAALACWLPARRAARVDPMHALRAD
jgi:predicted permease